MKTGIELISEERQRQIEIEGWGSKHDNDHEFGELARAAACYAIPQNYRLLDSSFVGIPLEWPFDGEWWKPTPENRVRELVKAGALILAEIDRLQRMDALNSIDITSRP